MELAKTFQTFMSDFVEAYRQRKRQENAFEFADISHYTIEILENFPQVREAYQERFHEVMVDEYQDTNHIQERMLELLSNGHNRFMVGDIKQSIYRFRQQTRRFSMRNSNAMRKIPKKASSFSSKKISVVVQKCCQQPMMSLNVSWTKRSAKSTMITCTSLFLPIPN